MHEKGADTVLSADGTVALVEEYIEALRKDLARSFYRADDDAVPCALVYFGVGTINAALSGKEPFHDGSTSWVEPEMEWDEIDELKFDPDNRWVDFALRVNRELWKRWDEEFLLLPYLHRSPLDSANGVRGNELSPSCTRIPIASRT